MISVGLDTQSLQSESTHTEYQPWNDRINHVSDEIRYSQTHKQSIRRTWGLRDQETPGRSERINFTCEQISWISIRDGCFCQLPLINDHHKYCGPMFPVTIGNAVHHIIPSYYSKWFAPLDHIKQTHNTPLNGIVLGDQAHSLIHNTWKNPYINTYMAYINGLQEAVNPLLFYSEIGADSRVLTFTQFCEMQAHSGLPMWNTNWDVAMQAIATFNTYKFISHISRLPGQRGLNRWYPFSTESFNVLLRDYELLINSKVLRSLAEENFEQLIKQSIYDIWDHELNEIRPYNDASLRSRRYKYHLKRLILRMMRGEPIGKPK